MNKEILRLSIPNIISNISIPLLSSVDVFLMGNLSAQHLGAVGIGSMIFNMIYWNFGFLRMGTTGITAQSFGAKDNSKICNTLIRAMLLSLIIAGIILILKIPLQWISFKALNVIPEQLELVAIYFTIRLLAAPATLGIYALNGWLFGMQNAFYPLIATILVNVINILLSYYLVEFKGLSIAGVAWGTVCAQYVGYFFLIAVIFFKYKSTFNKIDWFKLKAIEPLKTFLNVNKDIFIRTIFLTFAFAFFYSQSSKMGVLTLGANLILLQFLNWMSYGIDGFAYAAESLVGKYKGANNPDKLSAMINRLILWGLGLAIFYTLLFLIFGRPIADIFTDDQAILSHATKYLIWIYILPLAAFLSYMWDGIYIGLTASKAMRNSMFVAVFIYILTFVGSKYMFTSNHALWFSLTLFLLARGLIQYFLFRRSGLALK